MVILSAACRIERLARSPRVRHAARTERYRFVWFEIEDVNGVPRMLLGNDADVTHGGGEVIV